MSTVPERKQHLPVSGVSGDLERHPRCTFMLPRTCMQRSPPETQSQVSSHKDTDTMSFPPLARWRSRPRRRLRQRHLFFH